MKRIVVFILTISLMFSLFSCSHKDTITLTSNKQKESPSTVLSVEVPRRASNNESVIIKVGVGKRIYSQYKNYIKTILSIEVSDVSINGMPDAYFKEFDITEEQYLCTNENEPQYFIDAFLDFSSCEKTSGTITVKLISYFSNGEYTGAAFYIDYTIKEEMIIFSTK